MKIVDVLAAEWRDSIEAIILQTVTRDSNSGYGPGADTFRILSKQGKISFFFFDPNFINVLVAELRDLILAVIPQIIALLSHRESYVREVGADALSHLSAQGKISNLLT